MPADDAEKTRDSGRDVPRFTHPHCVHTSPSFVHRSAAAAAAAAGGHSSHPPLGVCAANTVYCMVRVGLGPVAARVGDYIRGGARRCWRGKFFQRRIIMSTPATETEFTPETDVETSVEAARRPRRRRTTKLERRIRFLQTTRKPMVPKKTFSALLSSTLRDVKPEWCAGGFRLSKHARTMLQADTEYMMSMLFAKALAIAKLRGGVTVSECDLRTAKEVSSSSFAPGGI
jgi:histone H3/H4